MKTSGHKQLQSKLQDAERMVKKVSLGFYSFDDSHDTFVASNNGVVPFNTQFFHDDYDDGPGFDDMYDGDGDVNGTSGPTMSVEAGERDLLSETQGQSHRVRPEAVNYSRRAKRVDVRKLKENIWKGLDINIPSQDIDNMDTDANMVWLFFLWIIYLLPLYMTLVTECQLASANRSFRSPSLHDCYI